MHDEGSQMKVQGQEYSEGSHMRTLQLLNVIKGTKKALTMSTIGLLYLDIIVYGRSTTAMVDTGAAHNFVSIEVMS